MVCRNPHITGPYFIPKKHPKQLNDQGFGSLLIVMTFSGKMAANFDQCSNQPGKIP